MQRSQVRPRENDAMAVNYEELRTHAVRVYAVNDKRATRKNRAEDETRGNVALELLIPWNGHEPWGLDCDMGVQELKNSRMVRCEIRREAFVLLWLLEFLDLDATPEQQIVSSDFLN